MAVSFLFSTPFKPSQPHQISPDLGLKRKFSGIYEVKLANCVAMDFYEIGVFGSEKSGVEVVMYGFNTPKSLQRMPQSGVVVGSVLY